jgi:AraC-like DNA-binding protein
LRELSAEGVDTHRQLALLSIREPSEGGEPQFLSRAQFMAFLKLVELLSKRADIGLRAGLQTQITQLGLFGLLLRSSNDGATALQVHQRYGGVSADALPTEVSLSDGTIVCRPAGASGGARLYSQYFCASTLSCARQLHGDVEPLEVSLSYPAPADLREHVRVLGPRLRFGAREDTVVFPLEQLSRTLVHRDAEVAEVLERHVASLPVVRDAATDDLRVRAGRLIAAQLQCGQIAMPEVARSLGLTERTLRRRLDKMDSSFQSLLDDARRERALQYVREGLTGPEAGRKLGFKGASAFRRAFRRWTGHNWGQVRKQA